MKAKKVIVITSTGDITPAMQEFFSKRYSGTELVIVSMDTEGEINLSKLRREYGKGEIITTKGALSQEQIDSIVKKGEVITEWTIDNTNGRPQYPFTHKK